MAKKRTKQPELFSASLQKWLRKRKGNKTLLDLNQAFGEKTFAIAFLILMALPALPLPTGGVTHVTEAAAMILAVQMIGGSKSVWLPHWAGNRINIGKTMKGKAGQKLISVIKWFEKWSRRRMAWLLVNKVTLSLIGLVVFIFTLAAFSAPPFSGLDTLPALGVVVISLALILEDSLILGLGILIGICGIGLEIAAGEALYRGLTNFF